MISSCVTARRHGDVLETEGRYERALGIANAMTARSALVSGRNSQRRKIVTAPEDAGG